MSEQAMELIHAYNRTSLEARRAFFLSQTDALLEAGRAMALCLARKGKILICGNGGSAADAQHIAAEFVNRFMLDRPPLPAIALTTDSSALTAIANDFGFELVFAKQVTALGNEGDVLLAISTSGNSPNVVQAIHAARVAKLKVIGLTGGGGGEVGPLCDILLNVPHQDTPAIQETHLAVEHLLCRLCDYFLFENVQEIMGEI